MIEIARKGEYIYKLNEYNPRIIDRRKNKAYARRQRWGVCDTEADKSNVAQVGAHGAGGRARMNAAITPGALDWDCIFREYHARVYAYIKRRVHRYGSTDELTEDLASEVFVKAIEATRRGYGPNTHLSAWIFGIARNLVIDEYRQRAKRGVCVEYGSLGETPHAGLSPLEQAGSTIGCEYIWHSIGRLTDKQKPIVAMQAQGYKNEDIAQELDLPLATVKGLLHRGRESLKEIFAMRGNAL